MKTQLVDGVEVRAVAALLGVGAAGLALADDDHDLAILQRLPAGAGNCRPAAFFRAFGRLLFVLFLREAESRQSRSRHGRKGEGEKQPGKC